MISRTTPYKPQFTTTRSVLNKLIFASWVLLAIFLMVAFFSGASSNLGGSLVLTLLGGLIGAIAIAVLSSVFVGIICLIDMRNMAAEKHFGSGSAHPPQAPRRPEPPQREAPQRQHRRDRDPNDGADIDGWR